MDYLDLIKKAESSGLKIHDFELSSDLKGLYYEKNIAINKKIDTSIEKKCVLAEEIGHFNTSVGNILDYSNTRKKKVENIGRNKGIDYLVSLEDCIAAKKNGVRNKFELAAFLNITEPFLDEALSYWQSKYGTHVIVPSDGNNYKYLIDLINIEIYEYTEFK